MVKVASLFSQLLGLVDRNSFERAVRQHRAQRGAKGFSCWEQFVSMLFCHVASANSLREICGGLATAMGKLVHLGVQAAPKRSTLSYANAHRPWQLYERTFYQVLVTCRGAAPGKKKFRFKNKLLSLDASVIDLCLTMFPWAECRQTKARSNSTCFSTTTATFRATSTSAKARCTRLTSPEP